MERRTRWESASGVVDTFFDDEAVPGTQGLPVTLLRQIEPFPTGEVVAYDTAFLSGHVVEHYKVVLLEAAQHGQAVLHEAGRAVGHRAHSLVRSTPGLRRVVRCSPRTLPTPRYSATS